MSTQITQDELTTTIFGAIENLPPTRKAAILLENALALIEAGRYGDQVENYIDVYLRTPGLPKQDMAKALIARGNARKLAGERLLAKAQQDLYFGEDQENARENLNRGLDIFDRVKADPIFAQRIKVLRLHWAYEEGDMLDLMIRIFRSALPSFKSLREFEWIGYPELRADVVQAVLCSHPHLRSLGLIGWHFDAIGVSHFRNLRKFTLRAEDDDGVADMDEIKTVLDKNEGTLRHLTLGAYLQRQHSWDSAFQSATIRNLTHLDLVDTRISHVVLARIAHAHSLKSLTLHGTFEEPCSASVVFGSDHIIDGRHTFLPHLESFRFVMVGHDDDLNLFQSVVQFLRHRPMLRRLDLGNCPWELALGALPDLTSLRALRIRIANMNQLSISAVLKALPREMFAIHLAVAVSDKPLPNLLSEKDFQVQTDLWASSARNIAYDVPSLDFVGWHGEHYVVVRHEGMNGMSGMNGMNGGNNNGGNGNKGKKIELKELPARRRLDCGKGVDLGSEDATWLERKDVPMDYEMPGLEV
ncbi:hypothetical protein NLI96_g9437 [Meripilus lineatus]|uniref:Uncharacterized protein n=1 Tax=Meripilus lineatus TaxID=2056292 RepID=A0AAD5UVQ0_9APHY|nr:hypothetical protein NLI96_g9437 [Physisporinus lineatus]